VGAWSPLDSCAADAAGNASPQGPVLFPGARQRCARLFRREPKYQPLDCGDVFCGELPLPQGLIERCNENHAQATTGETSSHVTEFHARPDRHELAAPLDEPLPDETFDDSTALSDFEAAVRHAEIDLIEDPVPDDSTFDGPVPALPQPAGQPQVSPVPSVPAVPELPEFNSEDATRQTSARSPGGAGNHATAGRPVEPPPWPRRHIAPSNIAPAEPSVGAATPSNPAVPRHYRPAPAPPSPDGLPLILPRNGV
jgi:hypothetical protein